MRRDMSATYDPEADAAYLRVGEGRIARTEEVAPGIVLDLTAEGGLVGIELIDVSRTVAGGLLRVFPPDAAE
jgi:uncharacterized protein YuzE